MRWLFGAHGQVAIGVLACAGAVAAWVYGATLHGEALIRWLFHISMAALLLAAYAIVATGLGYKATERVETAVVENIEQADEVNVTRER
jgi:hypothetical protein